MKEKNQVVPDEVLSKEFLTRVRDKFCSKERELV